MCNQNCHTNEQHEQQDQTLTPCTPDYNHITQHVNNMDDPMQQHTVYTNEVEKKVIQKEMDRLEHLGIIQKGLTSYSSPVVLVKRKNQNLYRVCSDF